jgi:hypothetical protein
VLYLFHLAPWPTREESCPKQASQKGPRTREKSEALVFSEITTRKIEHKTSGYYSCGVIGRFKHARLLYYFRLIANNNSIQAKVLFVSQRQTKHKNSNATDLGRDGVESHDVSDVLRSRRRSGNSEEEQISGLQLVQSNIVCPESLLGGVARDDHPARAIQDGGKA